MRVSDLDSFFYQRDLPQAAHVYGLMQLSGALVTASYSECIGRGRFGGTYRVRPVAIIKMLGHDFVISPSGEEKPIPAEFISIVSKAKESDKDSVTDAQAMLKRFGFHVNKRETREVARSLRQAMRKPQKVTKVAMQRVLDQMHGHGRYKIGALETYLEERRKTAVEG